MEYSQPLRKNNFASASPCSRLSVGAREIHLAERITKNVCKTVSTPMTSRTEWSTACEHLMADYCVVQKIVPECLLTGSSFYREGEKEGEREYVCGEAYRDSQQSAVSVSLPSSHSLCTIHQHSDLQERGQGERWREAAFKLTIKSWHQDLIACKDSSFTVKCM